MTIENRIGQPGEGQVAYGGGFNQPPERPPEAGRPPPEFPGVPEGTDVEIVDIAQLEAKREAQRERHRAYVREFIRQRYHGTKAAALAGDPEAQEVWARMQELNREGQRRWRQRNPEKYRAKQREYRRRKKLQVEEA